MELKRLSGSPVWYAEYLLIVPYGIETLPCMFSAASLPSLLIVPYGIETSINKFCIFAKSLLLIVPYGIETECKIVATGIL